MTDHPSECPMKGRHLSVLHRDACPVCGPQAAPTSKDESWVELKNGQPMPPDNTWVLVFAGKSPDAKMRRWWVAKRCTTTSRKRSAYWETDTDEGLIAACVTHWRPLPPRPALQGETSPTASVRQTADACPLGGTDAAGGAVGIHSKFYTHPVSGELLERGESETGANDGK